MALKKSNRFRAQAQVLSAEEVPLVLLEMRHALLTEPVRLVNDNEDLISNGHLYSRANFTWVPADDKDKQTPRAQLRLANQAGSGIGAFFERTNGGKGATFRVLNVMRSEPDFIEDDVIVDVSDVEVTGKEVTGNLGYDDVLNKVGTPYTYRPETAPGLF